MNCTVKLIWNRSNVWFTRTSGILGLCLESESFNSLIEEVRAVAPEMLILNCNYEGPVHLSPGIA